MRKPKYNIANFITMETMNPLSKLHANYKNYNFNILNRAWGEVISLAVYFVLFVMSFENKLLTRQIEEAVEKGRTVRSVSRVDRKEVPA